MPLLTLCADDFGLSRAVDKAVIRLVREGRLNAVSCMAGGKRFMEDAAVLIESAQAAPVRVEIGLHLTFTQYSPLGVMPHFAPQGHLPSVSALLVKSHLKLLPEDEVREEIRRQWQWFVEVMGRKPDFIDGHQHAHLLPQISGPVVDFARAELAADGWVRSCYARPSGLGATRLSSWRTGIVSTLSRGMRARLRAAGVRTNGRFYGVNAFDRGEDFGALMRGWLKRAAKGDDWAVIMCHPGLEPDGRGDKTGEDPVAERRADELAYLSGPDFPRDLAAENLTLSSPVRD